MSKIISFIFKQYDIGQWWGAAKSTFGNAAVYMSVFNTAMIVPMAYVTWIAPWLQPQGIAIPFWIFCNPGTRLPRNPGVITRVV